MHQANLTNDISLSADNGNLDITNIVAGANDTEVTYTFIPTASGEISDVITISCDDLEEDITINVTGTAVDPSQVDTYELFTGDLVEGDYVIYYGGKAMKNTVTSSRLDYSEVSPVNNAIANPDAVIVWHIAQSGDYWTIYSEDINKYAAGTTRKNQATLIDNITDYAKWTVSTSNGKYEFVNLGRANGTSDPGNKYLRNNGTNGWACYASATGGALTLYKKVLPPTNEAVTFADPEGGSLVIKDDGNPITTGATIQNGTVLDVEFGMTPAEAYKDVAIKVTKTDGGDDVTSTVYDATEKQITMPRYAITVAVTFTKLYKISLVIAGEGTGSATMNGVTTDIYVDDETQINLVANAVAPNEFTKWSATDKILINDESAAETYASASGDGTITATFGISELLPLGTPTLSDPTNITYSGVTLNWQELANAVAYNVELLLNDETVASDVIYETSWTPEVTLQANTTYTYTVQGVGDGITYAEDNNPKAQSTVTTADYPAVVLTLSENGIARNILGKLKTPIDLPTTSTQTCDDKVFMGWSATTIDGVTDAEPSLLGETYTFTNPEQPTATIYAVYAKETPGESSNWEITSIDKTGTGTGYAAYNGSHTTDNISYTTSQIMMGTGGNDNKMQFKKNEGMMYNTTPFGDDILFITIADITSNISVYEGSTEITTTPTSGAITLTNGKYTFSKGKKYFHIKMGSATGYSSKITVAVAGAPTYSNYCTTTPIVISGNIAWNNDVTINGNTVTIESDAVLTVNGALTNTNAAKLIIEDGGQLIVNNKGVQATMKKHIKNTPSRDDQARSWYTISSPLAASVNVTDVSNLIPDKDVSNTSYDLYYLNEKDGVWVNARPETGQSSSFTKIDKGVGYIYSNAATTDIAFKGEVNVADVDVKLSLTADKGKDYNLIGNPFMQNITLENIEKYKEIMSDGFFVLTNQDTWGTEPSFGTIAPLQGFLVQAKTAGNVTISKNVSSKGERSNEQNTNIEMIVSNASFKDNAYAMFGEGTGLNKVSHRNAQAPMLYVPQDGENFAIAFMDESTTIFPVSFKAMTTGSYSISLKPTDDVSTLVLVDNMTGTETNMLLEDSYTFIGSPADNENRFTVKLKISNSQDKDEHFAYQNGSELVINGEGTLQIFDVLGRVVISEEVHGQTVNVGGLNTGAYIVRLTGESVKTQKIVVR
ncbi:MAG: T9SS type A sorting domain-containing protein [bacterium]|nr:T9SS type A sorting domain-containing protein [Candidatus Limimorpha caballi]